MSSLFAHVGQRSKQCQISIRTGLAVMVVLCSMSITTLINPYRGLVTTIRERNSSYQGVIYQTSVYCLHIHFLCGLRTSTLLVRLRQRTFYVITLMCLTSFLVTQVLRTMCLIHARGLRGRSMRVLYSHSGCCLIQIRVRATGQ